MLPGAIGSQLATATGSPFIADWPIGAIFRPITCSPADFEWKSTGAVVRREYRSPQQRDAERDVGEGAAGSAYQPRKDGRRAVATPAVSAPALTSSPAAGSAPPQTAQGAGRRRALAGSRALQPGFAACGPNARAVL